ncbi:AAA family ATPase [Oceanobacillus oncorhynchi]|uniref:AAA family ATPase n=1 Tax=Oceanobacillus oncorhynchi TaxID=545501 RepID=UPI0018694EAB|nr:AAA family ATPase [Oceanobacillus oncorhynchi]
MRLLYFWFDEFKQLDNFEANLGSNFIFQFNKNTLTIKENNIYIENFFNIATISDTPMNVTAIVGENGSGKSTVLDFLSKFLGKKTINTHYLIIYTVDNKLYIDSSINNIKFDNKTSKHIFFCVSPMNLEKHLTLLFSNVLDTRSIDMVSDEEKIFYKNISTNYLISRYENNSYFLRSEFEKQIFFIHEYKEQLNLQNLIKIPDKIYIRIFLDEDNISYNDELEEVLDYLSDDRIVMDYFDLFTSDSLHLKFYSSCLKLYFIHIDLLLYEFQVLNNFEYSYREFLFNYSLANHKNIFDGVYKQLLEAMPKIQSNQRISFIDELLKLKENFTKVSEYFMEIDFHDIEAPYILTDSKEAKKFITLYQQAFTKEGCLKFTWSNMSSGEYGMLTLFSRFHHILQLLKKEQQIFNEVSQENNYKMPNLIIKNGKYEFEEANFSYPNSFLLLIDEGDLYFHPQWQKDWLIYFIKLSELLFKGEVQIILTTHSPFVLSDIPNSNVLFLRNNNHINTTSSFLESSPKTFASNIVELFSNSFFMKEGLIGSFAKEKVNLFIQNLLQKSPKDIYEEKEGIKKFIDTIGEPLIRNKLLEIYRKKIELYDNDDLGKRISILEQELNELKSKRKLYND